jgi:hypothetical protein
LDILAIDGCVPEIVMRAELSISVAILVACVCATSTVAESNIVTNQQVIQLHFNANRLSQLLRAFISIADSSVTE